jgi:histidinol dehydrogenase
MEVVKFADLLNQLGVRAEDTTKKIAESKQIFDEAFQDYQEAVSNYQNSEDEGEKEALREEIDQFEADLTELDEDLVKKIKSWDKNKEVWAKGQAALQEKRLAKKNGVSTSNVLETPITSAQPANAIPVGGVPVSSSFVGSDGVVKKKSSGGWWILAGIIGIVTLGAVVMKKE